MSKKYKIMKKSLFICILALIPFISGTGHSMYPGSADGVPDTLKVFSTEDLSDLLVLIQDEYKLANAAVDLDIELIADDIERARLESGELLLTVDPGYGSSNKGNWFITIGRDILVPVVSDKSPYIEALNLQGIELSSFSDLLRSGGNLRWGDILGTDSYEPISLFVDNGEFTLDQLQEFTGLNSEDIKKLKSSVTDDVANKVKNNKYALGFVRLADIAGSDLQSFIEGLVIVPIDQNENGRIDYYENYQRSYNDLTRAVWIGKYPRSLFSELRLVSSSVPSDKAALDFISWMLTSGQSQLTASGFSELVSGEIRSSFNHIYASETNIVVDDQTYAKVGRAFIWILGVVVILLLSGIVILLASGKNTAELREASVTGILDNRKVVIPEGVLFDKSHTWSYMEKNGLVRVGAADFLQHITGKVSKIIPRNPGESIKRGEPMFTIVQDGKQLVLYSPVSGTIQNVNSELTHNSGIINNSPYGDGWIYEVRPSKWMAEYRNFLMGDNYKEWLSKEVTRLKEFLGSHIFRNQAPGLVPVMQDGGEIVDNLLENMGPDLWEEFQLGFIDKAF